MAVAGAVLLLALGVFATPRHVVAQEFGGYADSLVFSVVPQDQTVAFPDCHCQEVADLEGDA
ncbi:MAG: hypothetical protein V3W28_02745 [Thermoplasmata archaeon]